MQVCINSYIRYSITSASVNIYIDVSIMSIPQSKVTTFSTDSFLSLANTKAHHQISIPNWLVRVLAATNQYTLPRLVPTCVSRSWRTYLLGCRGLVSDRARLVPASRTDTRSEVAGPEIRLVVVTGKTAPRRNCGRQLKMLHLFFWPQVKGRLFAISGSDTLRYKQKLSS